LREWNGRRELWSLLRGQVESVQMLMGWEFLGILVLIWFVGLRMIPKRPHGLNYDCMGAWNEREAHCVYEMSTLQNYEDE
jgi:hypothetical protein